MKSSCLVVTALVSVMIGSSVKAADFANDVLPIFEQHCTKCHGEKKAFDKLRLDSAEALQEKMAHDEHLIVPGNAAESKLYQRLTLPADNKKRMPKGADPLEQPSLDIIAGWINAGATFDASDDSESSAASNQPAEQADASPEAARRTPGSQSEPLPEVPAADESAIAQLTAAGALVTPLFAGSHLLDVSFAMTDESADDAALQALPSVAPQVLALDLKGARLSTEGWNLLSALTNVRNLKLHHSNFTEESAHLLAALVHLESLNLVGTQVGDPVLDSLTDLQYLRKLYLWQTNVSYDTVIAFASEKPGLEWNLGWNHPVVARKRLEKQQQQFTTLAKQAEEHVQRLKQELTVAEEASQPRSDSARSSPN